MVDGHVHIYDCYDLEKFFDNAVKNMNRFFHMLYPGESQSEKILLLTEGKKNDFFSRFKKDRGFPNDSGYHFMDTKEDISLVLARHNKPLCYLLKGRQIVTKENLEVLLVASDQEIEDGLPIETVIQRIIDKNDIAVLAWGFGKWFFKRGKIIHYLIKKYRFPGLFIGDNSGRPTFWPIPQQFKRAKELDIPIISGSDPLPFSDEVHKVGTYGFSVSVEGKFNSDEPAGSIWEILLSPEATIDLFGRRDATVPFFKRQSKIYLKKYLKSTFF
jgi:hypothetical protein